MAQHDKQAADPSALAGAAPSTAAAVVLCADALALAAADGERFVAAPVAAAAPARVTGMMAEGALAAVAVRMHWQSLAVAAVH